VPSLYFYAAREDRQALLDAALGPSFRGIYVLEFWTANSTAARPFRCSPRVATMPAPGRTWSWSSVSRRWKSGDLDAAECGIVARL